MNEKFLMDARVQRLYKAREICVIVGMILFFVLGVWVNIYCSLAILAVMIICLLVLETKRIQLEFTGEQSATYDKITSAAYSEYFYELVERKSGDGYAIKSCSLYDRAPFPFRKTDGILIVSKSYNPLWFVKDGLVIIDDFKIYKIQYEELDMKFTVSAYPSYSRRIPKDSSTVEVLNKDGSKKPATLVNYGDLIIRIDDKHTYRFRYSNTADYNYTTEDVDKKVEETVVEDVDVVEPIESTEVPINADVVVEDAEATVQKEE